MPSARELLEQADALMRRNRSQQTDDIPVLTDSVAELPGAQAMRQRGAAAHESASVPPMPDDDDPIPTLTERVETEPEADVAPEEGGEPSDWLQRDAGELSVTGEIPDSVLIVPPADDASVPEDASIFEDTAVPAALRTRARGLIAFDEITQTEEIEVVAPAVSDAAEEAFDAEFAEGTLAEPAAADEAVTPEAPEAALQSVSDDVIEEAVEEATPPLPELDEALEEFALLEAPAPDETLEEFSPPEASAPDEALEEFAPPEAPAPDEALEEFAPPEAPALDETLEEFPPLAAPALEQALEEDASPLLPALNEALEEVAPPVQPAEAAPAFARDTASEELAAASISQGFAVTPSVAGGPATADQTPTPASDPFRDDARWESVAEEIRMQVLQRIDIFTDTGLREQLAVRLQPIVDRASADLVATINQHVGELLRSYVAEAIEREIESWRRSH